MPVPRAHARAPRRRPLLLLLLLAFALADITVAAAQNYTPAPPLNPHNVDATHLAPPLNLNANWLLHAGDDPHFADPAFDDTTWPVISTREPIAHYLPHADRLWYRTHVRIAPGSHNLALVLRNTSGSLQVYANGVLLLAHGAFTPEGEVIYNEMGRTVPIPDALLTSGDLVISVRASLGKVLATHSFAGLLPGSLLALGPGDVLASEEALYGFRDLTSNSVNLTFAFILLLVASALAIALRARREYIALVIHVAAIIDAMGYQIFSDLHPHGPTTGSELFAAFRLALSTIAAFEFYRITLAIRRSRAIAVWEWTFAAQAFAYAAIAAYLLHRGNIPAYTRGQAIDSLVDGFFLLPLRVGIPVAAVWILRTRRNLDAALLLPPVLIASFFNYTEGFLLAANTFGPAWNINLGNAPIPYFMVGWDEVGAFAYTLALLLFIVIRGLRIARERSTLEAEVHAAQSVQQLLLTSTDKTPGFLVDIAYRPAAELGGDFFLISPTPTPDGAPPSLLAIVGDVSGKGLPAAMRVAMILGVLRREPSHDPAAILASLNDALLTQTDMGFTTACCVRLEPSGHFTLANAGHIPPYIGSTELPTSPALPLGLAPGQIYESTTGHLHPGQHLVLLSDGIPEARNRKGELFGFNRLAAIASTSATAIADQAEHFGQEDDITVLTLSCTA